MTVTRDDPEAWVPEDLWPQLVECAEEYMVEGRLLIPLSTLAARQGGVCQKSTWWKETSEPPCPRSGCKAGGVCRKHGGRRLLAGAEEYMVEGDFCHLVRAASMRKSIWLR